MPVRRSTYRRGEHLVPLRGRGESPLPDENSVRGAAVPWARACLGFPGTSQNLNAPVHAGSCPIAAAAHAGKSGARNPGHGYVSVCSRKFQRGALRRVRLVVYDSVADCQPTLQPPRCRCNSRRSRKRRGASLTGQELFDTQKSHLR
jgi:hypothetical protein